MNEYGITDEEFHYPAGRFNSYSCELPERIRENIDAIRRFPSRLRQRVAHLSNEKLDTPTRKGGWSVRTVVHHLADSHMNGFTRCKFLITENNPTILVADESAWVMTADSATAPIGPSLQILESLHFRWFLFLNALDNYDFRKTYHHPISARDVSLAEAVAIYAWHGNHHLAHVVRMLDTKGW